MATTIDRTRPYAGRPLSTAFVTAHHVPTRFRRASMTRRGGFGAIISSAMTDRRLLDAQMFIRRLAAGDLTARCVLSTTGDEIDGVLLELNLLAGELEANLATHEQFRHDALYDSLTALPNRVLLHDRLTMHLAKAKRDGSRVALFFLDLNDFKLVNDQLGHAIGDAVLREVGTRLQRVVRESDTVARYGGDEFIIASAVRGVGDARGIIHQVNRALRPAFACLDHPIPVSASIGVSFFPDDATGRADLILLADQAMYEQKHRRLKMHSLVQADHASAG